MYIPKSNYHNILHHNLWAVTHMIAKWWERIKTRGLAWGSFNFIRPFQHKCHSSANTLKTKLVNLFRLSIVFCFDPYGYSHDDLDTHHKVIEVNGDPSKPWTLTHIKTGEVFSLWIIAHNYDKIISCSKNFFISIPIDWSSIIERIYELCFFLKRCIWIYNSDIHWWLLSTLNSWGSAYVDHEHTNKLPSSSLFENKPQKL